jgi:hypothetical protein
MKCVGYSRTLVKVGESSFRASDSASANTAPPLAVTSSPASQRSGYKLTAITKLWAPHPQVIRAVIYFGFQLLREVNN